MIRKHRMAEVAGLLADASRAAMLGALQNGRALPAGALARSAGVSAATASAHLKKLAASGLIIEAKSGRHRYFRLAGHEVNDAIEALMRLTPPPRSSATASSPERRALCEARLCYDHLAGALGVALADALVTRKALISRGDDFALAIGPRAQSTFETMGIDTAELAGGSRPLVR
jgi:DNA-binding transcriptional ArsR family regulator